MILIIDHFDSFSYNLEQLCSTIEETQVVRCDKISVSDVVDIKPSCIVLSPGPGGPEDTGVTLPLLKAEAVSEIPMIGVCLGFQAMMHHFGIPVSLAPEVIHGKTVHVKNVNHPVLKGCNDSIQIARYHSLAVYKQDLNENVLPIIFHEDMVMAVEAKEFPWLGLQFHPESFLTPEGPRMIKNALQYLKK